MNNVKQNSPLPLKKYANGPICKNAKIHNILAFCYNGIFYSLLFYCIATYLNRAVSVKY